MCNNLRKVMYRLGQYEFIPDATQKELRSALISHGIIPNVCPNPRNGGDSKDYWLYDEEMYKERWEIERTNA